MPRPRLTPGISLRPWQQPWQICFVPAWQHWTMVPFGMKPPFQHIFLLRPFESLTLGQSRWLYVEWSFMGAVTIVIDQHQASPLHQRVLAEGAMLHWRGTGALPRPRMANGLWPLTCVTFSRQVLGLPFRYRVWTPADLWHELIGRGATVVVDPERRDSPGLTL